MSRRYRPCSRRDAPLRSSVANQTAQKGKRLSGCCRRESLRLLLLLLLVLVAVPVEQTHLDAGAFEGLCKYLRIATLIVIGNDYLGMEGFDGVGSFFRTHGVGVHADKGDVNILERAHFRSAFGVTGAIGRLVADGHD